MTSMTIGKVAKQSGVGVETIRFCERKGLIEMKTVRSSNEGGIDMNTKRKIEIFSAGCPACEEIIQMVNRISCPSCEVSVLDMHDSQVAGRGKDLGLRSVPAVVIDGKPADCCAGRGPDEATLRAAGLGQPIA